LRRNKEEKRVKKEMYRHQIAETQTQPVTDR
jgi:hypothetical protein